MDTFRAGYLTSMIYEQRIEQELRREMIHNGELEHIENARLKRAINKVDYD